MNISNAENIKKKNILILFFAILILMLNVFVPMVSIKIDGEENQYLNFEAIKESDNSSVNSLSVEINQINLLLWALVIIGFISFLGLILKLSEKAHALSNILIVLGCATFVSSLISFILTLDLIIKINKISDISAVFFIYVNLFLLFILLIATISLTVKIAKSFYSDYKKRKKEKKKISDEKDTEDIARIKKADSNDKTEKPIKKQIKFKMDDWSNNRQETIEFSDKDSKEVVSEEKQPIKTEQETKVQDTEKTEEPFPEKQESLKEIKEEKEDIKISDKSFEKALESAIMKKKSGVKQEETPEKKIEKKSISSSKEELKKAISKEMQKNKKIVLEKFNVKCPECGSIFEAEKQPDGITRTKCPNCGKEGVIK